MKKEFNRLSFVTQLDTNLYLCGMPLFDLIDGIKINVYSNDHLPPHIHALYSEYEAVITIQDREIIRGYLPILQLKKVKKIIVENETDLFALFKALNPQIKNL